VTVRSAAYGRTKPFRQPSETDLKQSRRSITASMNDGVHSMLAEKFILVIEALIKGQSYSAPSYSDGAPRVVSSSPHVPVVLPERSKS
jgi:hypothetical protein